MIRELDAQRERLRGLGIDLPIEWSPLRAFRKFDRFWREYVLAKYVDRVHHG
jgi:hypothetical protein